MINPSLLCMVFVAISIYMSIPTNHKEHSNIQTATLYLCLSVIGITILQMMAVVLL